MTDTIDPSGYVELHCHSCFSLLDGAASPEGLVDRAHALGQHALALTDHADLGGAVRFSEAGRARGVETIIGAELDITVNGERSTVNGTTPPTRSPFTVHRSRLGSSGGVQYRLRQHLHPHHPRPHGPPAGRARGAARSARAPCRWCHRAHRCVARLGAALLARRRQDGASPAARALLDIFGGRVAIECWDHGLPEERELVTQLIPLAARARRAVGGDERRALRPPAGAWCTTCSARCATSARSTRWARASVPTASGTSRRRRRWRGAGSHAPEGVRATLAIAERCAFRLRQLQPTLPRFPCRPAWARTSISRGWWSRARRSAGARLAPRLPTARPQAARARAHDHRASSSSPATS